MWAVRLKQLIFVLLKAAGIVCVVSTATLMYVLGTESGRTLLTSQLSKKFSNAEQTLTFQGFDFSLSDGLGLHHFLLESRDGQKVTLSNLHVKWHFWDLLTHRTLKEVRADLIEIHQGKEVPVSPSQPFKLPSLSWVASVPVVERLDIPHVNYYERAGHIIRSTLEGRVVRTPKETAFNLALTQEDDRASFVRVGGQYRWDDQQLSVRGEVSQTPKSFLIQMAQLPLKELGNLKFSLLGKNGNITGHMEAQFPGLFKSAAFELQAEHGYGAIKGTLTSQKQDFLFPMVGPSLDLTLSVHEQSARLWDVQVQLDRGDVVVEAQATLNPSTYLIKNGKAQFGVYGRALAPYHLPVTFQQVTGEILVHRDGSYYNTTLSASILMPKGVGCSAQEMRLDGQGLLSINNLKQGRGRITANLKGAPGGDATLTAGLAVTDKTVQGNVTFALDMLKGNVDLRLAKEILTLSGNLQPLLEKDQPFARLLSQNIKLQLQGDLKAREIQGEVRSAWAQIGLKGGWGPRLHADVTIQKMDLSALSALVGQRVTGNLTGALHLEKTDSTETASLTLKGLLNKSKMQFDGSFSHNQLILKAQGLLKEPTLQGDVGLTLHGPLTMLSWEAWGNKLLLNGLKIAKVHGTGLADLTMQALGGQLHLQHLQLPTGVIKAADVQGIWDKKGLDLKTTVSYQSQPAWPVMTLTSSVSLQKISRGLTGALQSLTISIPGESLLTLLAPLPISWQEDTLKIGTIKARLLTGLLEGTVWPKLTGKIIGVDLAALQKFWPLWPMRGKLNGRVDVTTTPLKGETQLWVDNGKLLIPGFGALSDFQFKANGNFAPEKAQLNLSLTQPDLGNLQFHAVLPNMSLDGAHIETTGSLTLRFLMNLLLPIPNTISGTVRWTLKGVWGDPPKLSGTLTLADGFADIVAVGTALHHVNLEAQFQGQKITLAAQGQVADKGHLSLAGEAALKRDMDISYHLNGTLKEALVYAQEQSSVRASGDLKVTGTLQQVAISGDILVTPDSVFHIPDHFRHVPEVLPVTKIIEKNHKIVYEPDLEGESVFPINLAVNLHVPNLTINGFGLASAWHGAFQVSGSPDTLNGVGRLDLGLGTLTAIGRTFDLEEGWLELEGPVSQSYNFFVRAVIPTSDLVAYLEIRATPGDMQLALRSEPQAPEAEILSWILFNSPSARLSGVQAFVLAHSLLSLRNGDSPDGFLSNIEKSLHLDSISLDSDQFSPGEGQMLSVGTHLPGGYELKVAHGMSSDDNILELEKSVTRNLSVDTFLGSTSPAGLGLRWVWRLNKPTWSANAQSADTP